MIERPSLARVRTTDMTFSISVSESAAVGSSRIRMRALRDRRRAISTSWRWATERLPAGMPGSMSSRPTSVEEGLHPGGKLAARPDRVEVAAEADVLGHRQRGDDAEFLGDIGDAGVKRLVRCPQPDLFAGDFDRAGVGALQAREDLDERALSGAVLAEKRHHLAALQREVHALQGRHGAVALGNAAHAQNGIVTAHRDCPAPPSEMR